MAKLLASELAVLLFPLAPKALKAGPLCPLLDATKHGTYGVYGAGTAVGVGPAAAVGEITYDGRGHAAATFTVNINGKVQTYTDVPSTYTINSDCTETAFEAGAHYSFVTSPDGNRTTWLETDLGVVFSGTEVRLNPVRGLCGASAIKRQTCGARFAPRCFGATREFPLKNRACQPPALGSFKTVCGVLILVLAPI